MISEKTAVISAGKTSFNVKIVYVYIWRHMLFDLKESDHFEYLNSIFDFRAAKTQFDQTALLIAIEATYGIIIVKYNMMW